MRRAWRCLFLCVCVCVCVCEREREKDVGVVLYCVMFYYLFNRSSDILTARRTVPRGVGALMQYISRDIIQAV